MTDTLARMRQLNGTTAQWAANNIVLANGEVGVERVSSTDVRLKVGDGVSTWSALPYCSAPSSANAPAVVKAWESIKVRMRLGRVDVLGIGDSNQILNGHGWDHGFPFALSKIAPMWATGLISQNENNGNGSGMGYLYSRAGSLIGSTSGAPAELAAYMDKGLGGWAPWGYTYVADGATVNASTQNGLILDAAIPLDQTAALEFDIHYGTFPTGSGAFRASSRLEQPGYGTIASNAIRSTNTGAYGMAVETVVLPADPTRAGKIFGGRATLVGTTGITGPYFNTYMRFRNPAQKTGFAYGTLNYQGGQSLRTMAYAMQQASDTSLTHYFNILRNNQGSAPRTFLICINSGLNDRAETRISVGPAPTLPGDSAAAFLDNFMAIETRLRGIWTLNGWDQDELFFMGFVSHPQSVPDDAELISYRNAIYTYLNGRKNCQVINLGDLTTQTEMTANGWYLNGTDKSHLSQTGYQEIAKRILSALQ